MAATLYPLQRGSGDPTQRCGADGVWRTSRTPEGPASLHISPSRAGEVAAAAFGPGAAWVLERLPDLLGARDTPEQLVARHAVVAESARRHPGLRIGRTGLVLESLLAAVLEQLVTTAESWRSWRELLRRFGDPAPGPAPAGMRVLPEPGVWLRLPDWEWHRCGVDGRRRRTLVAVARVATALERTVELSPSEAVRRLRVVPGVGAWTVAQVAARAYGDADAVPVGDYHLPTVVGLALAGRPLDDAGMLETLAAYRGHRYRVIRLVTMYSWHRPRFGPRLPLRDFRRM